MKNKQRRRLLKSLTLSLLLVACTLSPLTQLKVKASGGGAGSTVSR